MSTKDKTLRPEQREAIRLLSQGNTDQQVGNAVGRHRVTVTNWRNRDPVFIAAYNQHLADLDSAFVERARALDRRALDTVEGALDDPAIALRYLGLSQAMTRPARRGPTDPDEVRASLELMALLKATRAKRRARGEAKPNEGLATWWGGTAGESESAVPEDEAERQRVEEELGWAVQLLGEMGELLEAASSPEANAKTAEQLHRLFDTFTDAIEGIRAVDLSEDPFAFTAWDPRRELLAEIRRHMDALLEGDDDEDSTPERVLFASKELVEACRLYREVMDSLEDIKDALAQLDRFLGDAQRALATLDGAIDDATVALLLRHITVMAWCIARYWVLPEAAMVGILAPRCGGDVAKQAS